MDIMKTTVDGLILAERSACLYKLHQREAAGEQRRPTLETALALVQSNPDFFASPGHYKKPITFSNWGAVIVNADDMMDFRDANWIVEWLAPHGFKLHDTLDEAGSRCRYYRFRRGAESLDVHLYLDEQSDSCKVVTVGVESYTKYQFVCAGDPPDLVEG